MPLLIPTHHGQRSPNVAAGLQGTPCSPQRRAQPPPPAAWGAPSRVYALPAAEGTGGMGVSLRQRNDRGSSPPWGKTDSKTRGGRRNRLREAPKQVTEGGKGAALLEGRERPGTAGPAGRGGGALPRTWYSSTSAPWRSCKASSSCSSRSRSPHSSRPWRCRSSRCWRHCRLSSRRSSRFSRLCCASCSCSTWSCSW